MYLKLPPYDKKLETVLMGSNSIFFNTRNQLQDLPFLTTLFKDFNLQKHIGDCTLIAKHILILKFFMKSPLLIIQVDV